MIFPWLKFYPADWLGDMELRASSFAARGLWIDLLALMHTSSEPGRLLVSGQPATDVQLAKRLGADRRTISTLLQQLHEAGVLHRDEHGAIFSRKMLQSHTDAAKARATGAKGGNPALLSRAIEPNSAETQLNVGGTSAKHRPRHFEESTPNCAASSHHIKDILKNGVNPLVNTEEDAEEDSDADKKERLSPQIALPLLRVVPPGSAPPAAPPDPRGTRLSPAWEPSQEDSRYAAGLGLDVAGTARNFKDFWIAKAGKDARKADWSRTWQTWCRRDAERAPAQAAATRGGARGAPDWREEYLRKKYGGEAAAGGGGPVIDGRAEA
jgi:hypothetical protein